MSELIKAVVVTFIVTVLIGTIASFWVMIGVGNLHAWWSFVPTMGFWEAFSVTLPFSVPLSLYAGYNSSKS